MRHWEPRSTGCCRFTGKPEVQARRFEVSNPTSVINTCQQDRPVLSPIIAYCTQLRWLRHRSRFHKLLKISESTEGNNTHPTPNSPEKAGVGGSIPSLATTSITSFFPGSRLTLPGALAYWADRPGLGHRKAQICDFPDRKLLSGHRKRLCLCCSPRRRRIFCLLRPLLLRHTGATGSDRCHAIANLVAFQATSAQLHQRNPRHVTESHVKADSISTLQGAGDSEDSANVLCPL